MSGSQSALAALDGLMAVSKTVILGDAPPQWRQGYHDHEQMVAFPLEVEGELRGVRLEVIALPNAPDMQFRLCLIASTSICRLDFTDETHTNTYGGIEGLPPLVVGPHYHSWRTNRRFFHNSQAPTRLYNAETYTGPTTSFDNILRWFCADIHVESLPHDHRIQLPLRDQLW